MTTRMGSKRRGWRRGRRRARRAGALVGACLLLAAVVAACSSSSRSSATGRVLLVGTYQGHPGQYPTIQAAVDAAKPGDWILVAPGDYHETADRTPTNVEQGGFGGVLITTPGIHLRGMNRDTVVVDGTKPGAPPCSVAAGDQSFGAPAAGGQAPSGAYGSSTISAGAAVGRNGIVVYRAGGVSIDNLTVCNFLAGSGPSGNQIWWNGGADTGTIGLSGYSGSYLTATSTYYGGEQTAATYGIFSSNAAGPGTWNRLYASNFNDSGLYVGACRQACDVTVTNAWAEYSALGYSGTNSGGTVMVTDSRFDNNQDGFDTNTQIDGDAPAPQDGTCPNGRISPVTHTHSCWVFAHNVVSDNNNPDVPKAGAASAGPAGTGMTISGGRNDTVMGNTFSNNGAWGVLFVPYPDSNPPVLGQTCSGTGGVTVAGLGCVYDPEGDALVGNTFSHNGFFGNPSNADYGQITIDSGQPQNCFSGNAAPDGSAPAGLEQTQPTCGAPTKAPNTGGPLLAQVLCDTGFGACPAGAHYPPATSVVMHPLPAGLAAMPNPCVGVPANAWCPKGKPG